MNELTPKDIEETLRVPWKFSEGPRSDSSRPNLSCPEGTKVGATVASIADKGKQILEVQGLNCGERCDDCAFTQGTMPNGSLATLGDAVKCVVEGIPFYCHRGTDPGTRICGGWLDAVAHPALHNAEYTADHATASHGTQRIDVDDRP